MLNQLIIKSTNAMTALQSGPSSILKGAIPIVWFGNHHEYEKSELKVITVALNPSDDEFHNRGQSNVDVALRFPDYKGTVASHMEALDKYFEKNPYKLWFNSGFEPILNGMGASYYSGTGYANRVLHTDICCPFATSPTWSDLSSKEKKRLFNIGFQLWKELVKILEPDVLLFSISNQFITTLGINQQSLLCQFDDDKDGKPRKSPVKIHQGLYGSTPAVLGRTWNYPFGALGKNQKEQLGKTILNSLP